MEKETKKKTTTNKTSTKVVANQKGKTNTTKKKPTSTNKNSSTNNMKKETTKQQKNTVNKDIIKTEKEKPVLKEQVKVKKEKYLLDDNEMLKLTKIVLAVTAILLVIYLATYLIKKNEEPKKNKEEPTQVTIQYEEILAKDILKQNQNEYYVLVYDKEDIYNEAYNVFLSSYSSKENKKNVYKLNLSLGFNKNIKNEEANLYTSNINELKISSTTLLKIQNGKVIEGYEGKDSILTFLKKLVK
ncbi:MAG: hypothetical protein RR708_03980 [Bacilli bacterium]